LHPDVRKLVAVQKVDQEIARIRRDLDSLPKEQATREKKLGELKKAAELKKNAFVEAELEIRRLEQQIKSSDDEVKKLDGRLNTVKNNAEYQAILFQIDSVKKERSQSETEALAKMESIEALKGAAKDAQGVVADEEKVFAAFLQEAKIVREAREAEIAKVSVGRASLIGDIPKPLLATYDRLFGSRDSLAVCAVESQVCQGCYTRITPNDLAKLMGKSTMVQCGSCQRILYLPE
jgi:predicted  nucleic acid-binding Zn-ribbon protein